MTAVNGKEEPVAENKVNTALAPEDGEITDPVGSVPTPPAKRRKCGRESLLEQKNDVNTPPTTLIRSTNIVWVDLEMTGLDINKDVIMEMACIVTDKHLNVLEEGPNIVIHQPDEILDTMGEWCKNQHGKTGLTEACRTSPHSIEDTEKQFIEFISKYCPKARCELAGNSIHTDRKFLEKYMPGFVEYLHYRIIDVSSIRNVAWRWYPDFQRYDSNTAISHRALDDIQSSIRELQYYKDTVFKTREQYSADNDPAAHKGIRRAREAVVGFLVVLLIGLIVTQVMYRVKRGLES